MNHVLGKESMPKPATHTLLWSAQSKTYALLSADSPPQSLMPGNEEAWLAWLTTHSSFSFQGQYGHLSVLKEARPRGGGYWYAYHTVDQQTRKRYLGRSAMVTLARLEQVAQELSGSHSPVPLAQTSPGSSLEQRGALLSSRLSPPRQPISLVERSRLLEELDAVHTHPLTLVSASAGSGKTTLLSAWAASSRQGEKQQAVGLAWLSLEALDNHPLRFWASVIAALRTSVPGVGETALTMLHSQEAPPLSTILTNLLNELGQVRQELILILDDYHVIEDQIIQETMLFLTDHLPSTLHLILATRTDPELPLSRFRVRGQMVEIRSSDLRFTQEEATSFLLQHMGLPLSQEDVATLQHRTEGWIAGLQLAALSLRKQQNISDWVSDFAGSYRYLLDYVEQDILAWLPVPLQDFLLQTSIVTRMNAALCQAITAGPSLQASQQMLEELERANLFVVPLDEQRKWYRYHDLFREALHTRLHALQPELVPLLHQRAARWYETQGEWREAIAHALAAPDYPLAASLMEQAAPAFWLNGEASTVHNWVLALPDPALHAHPRLALDAALRFLNSVHLSTETVHASMAAQVEQTIRRMEELLLRKSSLLLSEAEVALIGRRLLLLRALIEVRAYFRHGDKERLRFLAQEVEALPQDEEVSWKLIPLTFAFWLALALQQDSILLAGRLRAAKLWISEAGDYQATFRVMTWLTRVYIEAGQLHPAHQEALSALALLKQIDGSSAVAGYLLASLFDISYAWNQLEEASDTLHRLLHIAQDWQQVELLAMGQRAVVRLALARGDLCTAQEALHKAEALLELEEFANNARWVAEIRIQVWLAQGNLADASNWAAQTTLFLESWDPLRKWEVLLLVRVSLAQQQYARAVETLEYFREHLEQPVDIEKTLEWMALYVVALHHADKRVQAAHVAARLRALTEPENYIRLYLDAGEPMREALEALLEEAADKEGPDALQGDENSRSAAKSPVGVGDSLSRSFVALVLAAFEQSALHLPPGARALPFAARDKSGLGTTEVQRQGVEPLSRQELRVLRRLCAGQTYAEMAKDLVVSPNTIKTQVSSIYRKLGVSRRAEAIAVAARQHLL
jgi:LuxR family maltose regulon positive regulatory protein